MNNKITKSIYLLVLIFFGAVSAFAQTLAFPEAEGFGKDAVGGRGGDVYHVTNLNDDGVGSFRYGIENMSAPGTIVFDVSGTIMLNSDSPIKVKDDYLTIAGQTAPGDGITIGGSSFVVQSSHGIVRYVRFRLGDQGSDDDDTISIVRGSNIIFDHVTASWSIDETFSCQSDEVDLLSIQWCLISESLNNSHHTKGPHGYGGIIGSLRQSIHHNLYAHHASRSPKVTWRQHCEVDFRNNVIYNWGYNNCYDGATGYLNWANNYYKFGSGTNSDVKARIFELSDEDAGEYLTYETALYAEGNYVNGYPAITSDNWNGGINFMDGATEVKNRKNTAHNFEAITEQSAVVAYPTIVQKAGASLVRDMIDTRIANEVTNGTTTYSGSISGISGIIDSQADVGGWPTLTEETRVAGFDTDLDGMPDTWESLNSLYPNDANDRNNYDLNGDYTNLEVYLNGLTNTLSTTKFYAEVQESIRCFPNPAYNSFSIDLRKVVKPYLAIYNTLGQNVINKKVSQKINKINTERLSPGIYLVVINSSSENKTYNKKKVIR